ncbi:ImmA/IrrE family metallo-endopeptidase [Actibacterium sp. MT2.3-13A]|uniref:ImmA/IrrE family metallo-endopeptidase n=1 Tax=Actibacterium sp. MT2.3-13A TaxID=2828332 RepID=UPI001BA8324C|nr:ImmA/IrrE family metallo-endopeptidase [Actibacterium sp. MT2.3-13A]
MHNHDEMEVVRRFSESGPVDILGLIHALGIRYEERPMHSGASGEIVFDGEDFIIAVNEAEIAPRKRFTAAHELAHYLLHRDLLEQKGRLNRHSDVLFGDAAAYNPPAPFSPTHEVQANRYAAELLMPASRIRKLWKGEDVDNVEEIASALGVSKKAVKIRLKTLNLRSTSD